MKEFLESIIDGLQPLLSLLTDDSSKQASLPLVLVAVAQGINTDNLAEFARIPAGSIGLHPSSNSALHNECLFEQQVRRALNMMGDIGRVIQIVHFNS